MIEIIIPYRNSGTDELKYTLRSIEKHFKRYHKIIISGDKPNWIKNVYCVDGDRRHKTRQLDAERNIYNATFYLTNNNFILWNDDFILLKDIDYIKNQHQGTISEVMKQKARNPLTEDTVNHLMATEIFLSQRKPKHKELLAYTLHIPVQYEKDLYLDMYEQIQDTLVSETILPRTVYGNLYGTNSTKATDHKIYYNNQPLLKKTFVSTWEHTWNGITSQRIREMFKEKSQYEK